MRNYLFIFGLIFVLAACNKTDDVTITGNVPPPDHAIDSATIQGYVDKAYINIVGREPVGNEKADAIIILKQDNFSVSNRQQFLATLYTKPEYNRNLYNVVDVEYLRNLDTGQIVQQIYVFQTLLTQPQYAPFYDQINFELGRLYNLQNIVNDMNTGAIDYRGMLHRCVDNYFYDQINMGAENFVISTFQNFFFRYPSTAELTNGENMVNGLNATILLQTGQTKQDYINIFFNSGDYYEGQVRFIFKKYLFREPTSAEIGYYSNIYKANNDYRQLETAVFSLDEYAGTH